MSVLVGICLGVALGILWARVVSPRVSWLPFIALLLITGVLVWGTIHEFSDEPIAGILGGLTVPLTALFLGPVFMKEEDGMEELPYRSRLRLWISPQARKTFYNG